MPATPAGAREAFAEAKMRVDVEGASESIAKVSKFGRAIEQLTKIHRSSVDSSKEFDWASQSLGKTHGKLQAETLRMNYLYRKYEGEIHDVAEGVKRASSLTNDQVEVMKELFKVTDRILKSKRAETELNKELRENLEDIRKRTGKATFEFDKMHERHESLSETAKFLGEAWSESFGQLKTGSKEADEVLGIIKSAFKKIEPMIKPYLDQTKRAIKDAFAEEFGIKIDKAEIFDAIKKFKAEISKSKPISSEGVALEGKVGESVSPGKSIGDMGKMAGAIRKTEATAEGAGKAMAAAGSAAEGAGAGMAAAGSAAEGAGAGMAAAGAGGAAAAEGTAAAGVAAGATIPPLLLVVAVAASAYAALVLLAKGFQMNIDQMENFRRAGHRASGSIRELLDTSTDLGMSLGASSEQAYGTVQALTEAGFAVDSLGESLKSADGTIFRGQKALLKLAEANLKFSDATGSSRIETARLQKRLTAMGKTAEDQEAVLGALTQAAEKYGLTGEDLSSIIQNIRKNSIQMEVVWEKTNIYDYTKAVGALTGSAKRLGVDMSVAAQALDDLANASDRALKIAAMGGGLGAFFGGDQTAQMKAMVIGADTIIKTSKQYEAGVKRIRYLEAFGGAEYLKTLAETKKTLEKQEADKKAMSKEELARDKLKQESIVALDKGYDESTKTITQSFKRLLAPILMLAAKIMGPLVDAIMEMATVARPVIDEIISAFSILWNGIKEIFAPLMPTIKLIAKFIGGVLLGAIYSVTTIMKVFGIILSGWGMAFQLILAPVNLLIEGFGWLIDFGIGCLIDFGKWIDKGVASFWEFVKPVTEFIDRISNLKDFGKWITSFSWFDNAEKSVSGLTNELNKTGEAALDAKGAMEGSSFLHIKEGIREILPIMNLLWESFRFLTTPIDWIKTAIDWVYNGILKFVDKVKSAFDIIIAMVKFAKSLFSGEAGVGVKAFPGKAIEEPQKAVEKAIAKSPAEGEKKPMGVYTVKFNEDLMTTEAENKSVSTASIVEMAKLMKMLVNKEGDINNAKTAAILEKMERQMGNTSQKKAKPGITSSRQVFGEKLNRWW